MFWSIGADSVMTIESFMDTESEMTRVITGLALVLAIVCSPSANSQEPAAQDAKRTIELMTDRIGVLGMPLPESQQPVYRVLLNALIDGTGQGSGTLTLDCTPATPFDEFGFEIALPETKEIKLDCKVRFIKKVVKQYSGHIRPGGQEEDAKPFEVEWQLYSITGPKITSALSVSIQSGLYVQTGRLLIHSGDGQVKHMLPLHMQPQPEPCHPGCFPRGTQVRVAKGTVAIEGLRPGDKVVTIDKDGQQVMKSIEKMFITRNRLIEIRTTGGNLITTITQPLALAAGGFREAGQLRQGEQILRWEGNQQLTVTINEVTAPMREEQVFNLVLGPPTTFIANHFLARSKPPVGEAVP